MTPTRRGIFGFLAGAPVAVATAKEQQPEPEFFVGQVRAVHSHYETAIVPRYATWSSNGQGYSQMIPATEVVSVTRHEQWSGTEWLPIDQPKGEEP